MPEYVLTIIKVLYSLGGLVNFIGFIPTIRDLLKGKPSANTLTYWIWTLTTLIFSIYGFTILQDMYFLVVINLQLIACVIVLTLKIRLDLMGKSEI